MIDGILAAFKSYTPDDLDKKSLPELAKLYIRAQRVIKDHPTLVALWSSPESAEPQNDPDLAGDFM